MWNALVDISGISILIIFVMRCAGFDVPIEIPISFAFLMFLSMGLSLVTETRDESLSLVRVEFDNLKEQKSYLGFFLGEHKPLPFIQLGKYPNYIPDEGKAAYVFYEIPFDCDDGLETD